VRHWRFVGSFGAFAIMLSEFDSAMRGARCKDDPHNASRCLSEVFGIGARCGILAPIHMFTSNEE